MKSKFNILFEDIMTTLKASEIDYNHDYDEEVNSWLNKIIEEFEKIPTFDEQVKFVKYILDEDLKNDTLDVEKENELAAYCEKQYGTEVENNPYLKATE